MGLRACNNASADEARPSADHVHICCARRAESSVQALRSVSGCNISWLGCPQRLHCCCKHCDADNWEGCHLHQSAEGAPTERKAPIAQMASFVNSFALLEGDAPSTSAATNKKKKSKKGKGQASSALPPSGVNHSAAPTAAPASDDENAADDGFQLAGKVSRRTSIGSRQPSTPASAIEQRTVSEGLTDLKTAARQTPFSRSADRVSQWKAWQQQVLS